MADIGDMMLRFPVAQGVWAGSASMLAGNVANTNISVEGVVVYDATAKTLQLCDGDDWQAVSLGTASDSRIGTLAAGKWCSSDGSTIACTADAPVALAGSDKQVIFNDGGAALAGASQLFWDKANNRLGIGTDAPDSALTVSDETNRGFRYFQYNNGDGANLRGMRARGTINAPMPVLAGDRLTAVTGFGHDGTDFASFANGTLGIHAAENFTLTAQGTYISFSTSPLGAVTPGGSERMRIAADGSVGIGTATPASLLHVAGGVQIGNDADACPGTGNIKLGTMRYSAGAFSVCVAAGWTPLATGTGAVAAGSTGQVQFNGGSGVFAADARLHWNNTSKRLGIGTTTPLGLLQAHSAGSANITVSTDGDAVGEQASLAIVTQASATAVLGQAGTKGWSLYGRGDAYNATNANHIGLGFWNGTTWTTAWSATDTGLVGIGMALPEAKLHLGNSVDVDPTNMNMIRLWNDTPTTRQYGIGISNERQNYRAQNHVFMTPASSPVEVLRIANTGNVGIGTAAPAGKLHVYPGNAMDTIIGGWMTSTNTDIGALLPGSTAGSLITGASNAHMVFALRDNDAGDGFYFLTTGGSYGTDNNYDVMAMAIKSKGNVGIGMTNPSNKLHVDGSIGATNWVGAGCETACSSDGSHAIIYADGRIVITSTAHKPGGGDWTATSDIRLKDVDGDYTVGLAEITALRPVRYHYKKDNPRREPSDRAFVGLVAQEVQEVLPEAVSTRDDGYYDLDSTPINYAVINAIRELKAANDNQVEMMDKLRTEFDAYRAAHP